MNGRKIVCEIPLNSCKGFVRIECDTYAELPGDERALIAGIVESMMAHTKLSGQNVGEDTQIIAGSAQLGRSKERNG